jgi:hypothetical protein
MEQTVSISNEKRQTVKVCLLMLIAWATESKQVKFERARRVWSDGLPSTHEEQLKSLNDLVWLTEQGSALAATILFDLLERGIIVPNLQG